MTKQVNTPLRLLVVEDSEDDFLLLIRDLRAGGFDPACERVQAADELCTALRQEEWDMVISDYSMPHFSGLDALRISREMGLEVPFIFVSGTIGEDTAVAAMREGASDYIMKGNRKRLIPAIQRELREVEERKKRKRAETALRESETRYRDLVENAAYGIYQSRPNGRFLDVNPSLVRILGYRSKDELIATSLLDIWSDLGVRGQALKVLEQKDRINGFECVWKRKDGTPITVRLTARTIRNEIGLFETCESMVEDITERRSLEKQVAALQKAEAIARLAGGIAHDFNNVLGAVIGWAELGMDEAKSEAGLNRRFSQIRDQARRAANLVKQLLAFARQQVLVPHNISLNRVISDSFDFLKKIVGEKVKIDLYLATDLRLVHADVTQVEQILMNLAANARDAMPRGGHLVVKTDNIELDEVFCRSHAYARPGRAVRLTISDTGQGMDPATMERIFEPFFTTKDIGKGTGLGLATVYGIINQHGGFVEVQSEVGAGTSFHIYFPAASALTEDVSEPKIEAEVSGGTEMILVADDTEPLRDLAAEMLQALGYRVLKAADGAEAVRLFKEHQADVKLLLFDVAMPNLSGPEAYQKISELKKGVPVMFCTGYAAEAALLGEVSKNEAEILQKPYSSRSLLGKVRELLDRAKVSTN